KGRPRLLSLKECVKYFVEHRHDVTIRRTKFEKAKAEARAHILEGLIIAVDNIDEVVRIIRATKTPSDAQRALEARFEIDELQSKAIVDMRLSQLTGLRVDELRQEYADLEKLIAYLQQILDDPELCKKVMKDELQEVKEKYGDERRTEIKLSNAEFNPEQFYANDPVVITMSHLGYIKRTLQADFRAQSRGGVGARGARTREQDFTEYVHAADAHDMIMFFTKQGRVYWQRCFEIPEGAKDSKGRAIQNMLQLEPGDSVNAFLGIQSHKFIDEDFLNSHYVVFATKNGTVKRTSLADYSRPRGKGVRAINIVEGDEVVNVMLTNGHNELILASRNGRAVRFNETEIRVMGRVATGVIGMRLAGGDDEVVGMVCVNDPDVETIMVVSENGFGKRSEVEDYRLTKRGSKGVITLNITDKTGKLVAVKCVRGDEDLMIINKSGIAIRFAIADAGDTKGRNTQGVKLIELKKRNETIASVCVVPHEEDEEDNENENNL
ncbi:MAG: DNA gyrase subunit A, partial [Prevotella sp.]|nr:DNA gyrase subunit A [Prevotella sp.]